MKYRMLTPVEGLSTARMPAELDYELGSSPAAPAHIPFREWLYNIDVLKGSYQNTSTNADIVSAEHHNLYWSQYCVLISLTLNRGF